MWRGIAIGMALLGLTGCGVSDPPDNSRAFVSCLQQRGGQVITQGSQLKKLPSTDAQLASAVAFDSVSYASIDVESSGSATRRQALVFVEDPRMPSEATDASPSELLRRARADRADVRTLVLLPPAIDTEAQVGVCEQAAAPNQQWP